MASELPFYGRQNPFRCFDLSKFDAEFDPVSGPYKLKFLSLEKLKEFQTAIEEFGKLFLTCGNISGVKELRSQLAGDLTFQQIHEITSNKLLIQIQTDQWYVETAQKLSVEFVWKRFPHYENKNLEYDKLRIQWFFHKDWGHLPSPMLVRAQNLLRKIQIYAQNASEELKRLDEIQKLSPFKTETIALPKIPILQQQSTSFKNPTFVSPQFYNECTKYLLSLHQTISRENETLTAAMLARLEMALSSEDLQTDDVLYGLVEKIRGLAINIPSELTLSDGKKQFKPMEPRKTFNAEIFRIFQSHILEAGSDPVKAYLHSSKWLGLIEGIPCRLTLREGVLVLLPPEGSPHPPYFPSDMQSYEVARFNFAMHRLKVTLEESRLPSLPEHFPEYLKKPGIVALVKEFSTIFHFLQTACQNLPKYTLPHGPSPEIKKLWQGLLMKKMGEVLEQARPFLKFVKIPNSGSFPAMIPSHYLSFLTEIRDFCLFIQKEPGIEPPKINTEIHTILEGLYQQSIAHFFKLLDQIDSSEESLCHCLDLIQASVKNKNDPGIAILKKVLADDQTTVNLSEFQNALTSCLSISAIDVYVKAKSLLIKRSKLRPPSPPLVRLIRDLDAQNKTSLIVGLQKEGEASRLQVVNLLETTDFQTSLSMKPLMQALASLDILSNLHPNLETIINNFIQSYLSHFNGQSFRELEMILLYGSETQVKEYAIKCFMHAIQVPSVLLSDETQRGFTKILERDLTIRQILGESLTPLVQDFTNELSSRLDDLMSSLAEELPLFKIRDLTADDLAGIIKFFSPKTSYAPNIAESYGELLDQAFYLHIESLVKKNSTPAERFIEILNYNFREFPCSEKYKRMTKNLLEEIIQRPWSLVGQRLCEFLDPSDKHAAQKKYRIQWLKRLLQAKGDPEFANLPRPSSGYTGMVEFYLPAYVNEALECIENFLMRPWYHRQVHDFLKLHLSTISEGENTSQSFDKLVAEFSAYDGIRTVTEQVLTSLTKENFEDFKNEMAQFHTRLVTSQPYLSVLSTYYQFLRELEHQLRSSFRSDDSVYKTKRILDSFRQKYSTSKELIFKGWLSEPSLKAAIEDVIRATNHIETVARYEKEIRVIFNFINNIQTNSLSDRDWILDFPSAIIDICLDILTISEQRQLVSALLFLNSEKYNIFSKLALEAFQRLLKQESENRDKDIEFISKAFQVAEHYQAYQKLGADENKKQTFIIELKKLYSEEEQFLKCLLQILFSDPTKQLKERKKWENFLSILFPGASFVENSSSLVCSFTLGKRQFHPLVYEQLFKPDGSPTRDKGVNRHIVIPISLVDNQPSAHVKFFPDSPGIQRAVSIIRALLHGDLFPKNELLKFPDGTAEQLTGYPVFITEHIPGPTLEEEWNNNVEVRLDLESFSLEYVDALFTRPQDGKPGNYVCYKLENTGTNRLVPIENEAALGDSTVNDEQKIHLMHRCVLYCFDEMHQPIHPKVKEKILSLDISSFINSFISDATGYHNKLGQSSEGMVLFDYEECKFWETHKDNRVIIAIPLTRKLIEETIRVLTKLQELLLEHPDITHWEILKEIYPELIPFYGPALKKALPAKDRFKEVLGNEYLLVHGSHITQRNDTHVYLSLLGPNPANINLSQPGLMSGEFARDAANSVQLQIAHLQPIRKALLEGNIQSFKNLDSYGSKERVLNGIKNISPPLKLSKLSPPMLLKIFENIPKGGYRKLNFSDCLCLTRDNLLEILKKNPELRSLDLSRCRQFDQIDVNNILNVLLKDCKKLEILRLSQLDITYLDYEWPPTRVKALSVNRTPLDHQFINRCLNLTEFSKEFKEPLLLPNNTLTYLEWFKYGNILIFNSLRDLFVDNSPVQSIALVAPNLKSLHARGCTSLTNLRILTFVSASASLDASSVDKTFEKHLEMSCYYGSFVRFDDNYKMLTLELGCKELKVELLVALDLAITSFKPYKVFLKDLKCNIKDNVLFNSVFIILEKHKIKNVNFDFNPPNYTSAALWYQKGTEKGYVQAAFMLGMCYVSGRGVNRNLEEGIKKIQWAADKGLVIAQAYLGFCYANGEGVKKDPEEALKYLKLAAAQDDGEAQNKLGFCYASGEGVKKDPEEALKYLKPAADKGYAQAQYLLGGYYFRGEGVDKDLKEAMKYYRLAAQQGDTRAQEWVDVCSKLISDQGQIG